MSGGAGGPGSNPGSKNPYIPELFGGDPSVSPGLARPVGWRVRMPDGSAAWDKFGPDDVDWVPVGTADVVGAVDSINGQVGVVNLTTQKPGETITGAGGTITLKGGGQASVANLAALGALAAANFPIGNSWAWVATLGRWFQLQTSALPTGTNVVNASGLAGAQWLATNWLNPVWQAQTAWTVNTATGNDEAAGTSGAPLKTMSEVARRLAFATLTATTVTLIGNMAAGDHAAWTFNTNAEIALTIIGTPTTLYTGSVTTAVNVSPAPTTTENDLTDTAIPVSFTASGLLGNGVLFSFTSGITGSAFWAAKDLGSKTIRISQPHAAFGADHVFANGDTYVAQQLPSTQQMTFAGNLTGFSVLFQNVTFPAGILVNENCFYFAQCWFASPSIAANGFENCAFQGSGTQWGAGNGNGGFPVYVGGMWRGSGGSAFSIFGGSNANGSSKFTFQGVALVVTNGTFFGVTSDMLFYDCTLAAGPLQANYWSELFTTTAFGGSNNTALATVNKMGQISHLLNPGFVAGASTATNPIFVAGTVGSPITVAAESAGGGVVNANQNGIYAGA